MSTYSFSELLGFTSIACWLGAQFPQVVENFQRKSCEGLSLPFLFNWLLGDLSNLIGCILTHQLPFQTWLATYFCLVDFSLLIQYFYYGGGTSATSRVGVSSRSRTISRRALSFERNTSHYRTLSAVASNVAASAALAAQHDAEVEARHARKHQERSLTGHESIPKSMIPSEHVDEVDDTVFSAVSDSFHSDNGRGSGRKRVSWSQERLDVHGGSTHRQLSPVLPPSLRITSSRELPSVSPTGTRGRALQRDMDGEGDTYDDIEPSSRQPSSSRRTSSRASRRGAAMVFLGVWALFSFGTLTRNDGAISLRSRVLGRGLSTEVDKSTPTRHNGDEEVNILEAWALENSPVVVELPAVPDAEDHVRLDIEENPPSTERIVGRFFAWLCTTLYLTSRLPQIWKNYVRKSVKGLSLYLFVFAFLGNFFYVCSLLSSPPAHAPPPISTDFFKESIPYLLGSGSTFVFDVTIVSQFAVYRVRKPRQRGRSNSARHRTISEEESGLLSEDALANSQIEENRPTRSRASSNQANIEV